MAKRNSQRRTGSPSTKARRSVPPMTQPEPMKTKCYVYGVEKVNGYDAWALFTACAAGDLTKAQALLSKDPARTLVPATRSIEAGRPAKTDDRVFSEARCSTNLPDDPPWATPLAWAQRLGLADIEAILKKHRAE